MSKQKNIQSEMSAPVFDRMVEFAQRNPDVRNKTSIENILKIILPSKELRIQGEDELRQFWFEINRGSPEDFGDFKEYLEAGEVNNYDEFVSLWKDYYPDETKWYKFSVATYQNQFYVYIDSKLTFHLTDEGLDCGPDYFQPELIQWLYTLVNDTIESLKVDSKSYNRYIRENLSYFKRYGRILRSDYWKVFTAEHRVFQRKIQQDSVEILMKIVGQTGKDNSELIIRQMNAFDFYSYCEIGYEVNGYFKGNEKMLGPREKYLRMADGRDCGLRKTDLYSYEAFLNWYKTESHCGGHPWEICRGGNSTHISLFVEGLENGWILRLAGSSRGRVVETVKIAVALYNHKIPFKLSDAEEILRMITGQDYIGIVPDNFLPVYCHSHFPKEDRIIDFMNLPHQKTDRIVKKSYWYPLDETLLISGSEV